MDTHAATKETRNASATNEPQATETGSSGILNSIRILDLTSVVMGPYATQILGDMGADVICVEAPGGDSCRVIGVTAHSMLSGAALNLLRNKRNVCIDLKNPEGREALLDLAATCDVVVTNIRPGALRRLGLTYKDVRHVRPDIIYCEAHGFRLDSSRVDEPAYDDIIQASSGIVDLFTRVSGSPALVPTILADKVSGLSIAYAILGAIVHRLRTGQGQQVEVPMHDVVTAFTLVEHGADAIQIPARGQVGYSRVLSKNRRPFPTTDGYVLLLPYSRDNWVKLFSAGGREDAEQDPRIQTLAVRAKYYDELYNELGEIALKKTAEEWVAFCQQNSIPCSRIASLDDLVSELPEATHPVSGRFRLIPAPIRFSESPLTVRRHAPLVGEHNEEVFKGIGYSQDQIHKLISSGVLRKEPVPQGG